MIIDCILLALILCIIYSIVINITKTAKDGSEEPFSIANTTSLRGFAIIIIALSHIVQYEQQVSEAMLGGKRISGIIFLGGAIGVSIFFLLSGYGCYITANKHSNLCSWTEKHALKLICHFIFTYIITALILIFLLKNEYSSQEIIMSFFKLQILNTSTWYLKIQLMFYGVTMISIMICKKHSEVVMIVLSLLYATVADYIIGLPDYWWKTSLCFAAGYCVAKYKEKIFSFMEHNRKLALFSLIIASVIAYVLIRKDGQYRIYVQLPTYACISTGIAFVWDKYVKQNIVFKSIGKYTLDIYLVHIGIVESVFLLNYDLNIKVCIFILLTAFVALFSHFISEKLYKVKKS